MAPSPTENKSLVRRCFRELHEEGNIEKVEELFCDNVVHTTVHGGTVVGTEAIADLIQGLRTGFPDFEYDIETIVADGKTVAVRGTARGTHEGPVGDYEPTGESIAWTLTAFFTIEEGKISEVWALQDKSSQRQQLDGSTSD